MIVLDQRSELHPSPSSSSAESCGSRQSKRLDSNSNVMDSSLGSSSGIQSSSAFINPHLEKIKLEIDYMTSQVKQELGINDEPEKSQSTSSNEQGQTSNSSEPSNHAYNALDSLLDAVDASIKVMEMMVEHLPVNYGSIWRLEKIQQLRLVVQQYNSRRNSQEVVVSAEQASNTDANTTTTSAPPNIDEPEVVDLDVDDDIIIIGDDDNMTSTIYSNKHNNNNNAENDQDESQEQESSPPPPNVDNNNEVSDENVEDLQVNGKSLGELEHSQQEEQNQDLISTESIPSTSAPSSSNTLSSAASVNLGESKKLKRVGRKKKEKAPISSTLSVSLRPRRNSCPIQRDEKNTASSRSSKQSNSRSFNSEPRKRRSTTGVISYECRFCEKSFCQLVTAQAHERIHFGLKPYECPNCPKSFRKIGQLRQHDAAIHKKDRKYRCPVCGHGHAQLNNMKIHLKKKHPEYKN